MPLAGDEHDVPRPRFVDRGADRGATVAHLARARRAGEHLHTDRRRILSARVVVGDDHQLGMRGGDRDVGKRAQMGEVAAARSDLVIVTDDNPRGEDPALIRMQVLGGAPGASEVGDRRAAIRAAIDEARAGDIVLIAGKGHEQGQIVGAGDTMRVLPFDDVTVARECAAELAGAAS